MISLNSGIKKTANEYYNKNETPQPTNLKSDLDSFDLAVLKKLDNLRNTLSSDKVNIQTVKQQINDISSFDKSQNFDYLTNLLKPEKARGSKIPSQVPVPSCSFQLHNCITLSTNSSGNCALFMNPFFLASETVLGTNLAIGDDNFYVHKFLTSLWVNNNASLSGSAPDSNWVPTNIGQMLPPVYDQYRLVSASLVIKYIGRLDIAQGMIGGAIIYDEGNTVGGQLQENTGSAYNPNGAGTNTVAPSLEKFGNFDLAMDSFYHQENMCIEGCRELYFPIDNAFEEYVKVTDNTVINAEAAGPDASGIMFSMVPDYYKAGFNWFFYAMGCPPSSNCFKVDIYCNFECLPNAKYLNYMPITLNPYILSPEEKKKMILIAQNKPVLKVNEEADTGTVVPSLFNKMIKKFDNGLPGFDKMKAAGLMSAIPGLKPGLALAGTMLIDNMDY